MRTFTLMLSLLALTGCKKDEPDLTGVFDEPGNNPLNPDRALLPWPSMMYMQPDPTTVTGLRVAPPEASLPSDVPLAFFDGIDGFSRVQPILAYLPAGFDRKTLPDPLDIGATTRDGAPLYLVHIETGEKVPVLAEVDANAEEGFKALIIRPHKSLEPNARYAVVLTTQLKAANGTDHAPIEAFEALRDGKTTDSSTVEALRPHFAQTQKAIKSLGLAKQEVLLAWSFHTRSRESVANPLLAMHDAAWEARLPDWKLIEDGSDNDNRLVVGSIEVPNFLDKSDRIHVDADLQPIQDGTRTVEFLVTIPNSITEGPRPTMAFGHGFFSQKEESTWNSLNHGLQDWQISAITTNFMGFNEPDLVMALGLLGGPLDGLHQIIDLNLQSEVHFTSLYRVINEQLSKDKRLQLANGDQALDPDEIPYMGISNGGTQGLTITATSPAYERAVLVVGGCGWSHFLQRAYQWHELGQVFESRFVDPVELQLVISMTQLAFDRIDGANFADHLVEPRYPGRKPLEVTFHEAVGDTQVNNLLTEWCVRSAGVPLVTPSPRDVWGVETIKAPPPNGANVDAALLVYDEHYPPNPVDNTPPQAPAEGESEAHETIRYMPAYEQQVGAFLEDGTIMQVCDGACDPD